MSMVVTVYLSNKDKNYYIEYNGKLKLISENMIKKLKDEYYEKKIQEYKLQEQKSSELKTSLLKDNLINTVLPKWAKQVTTPEHLEF